MQKILNVMKIQLCLVVGITVVGCVGNGTTNSSQTTSPVYTTIFDAGSSGTRLSFYKVIPGNGGYPQISKLFEKEYNDNGMHPLR